MTNIVATLVAVIVTNWVSVSRTVPMNRGPSTYLVYIADTINQQGTVMTNFMARFVWKGQTNEVLLESVPVQGAPVQTRQVFENPSQIYLSSPN